MPVVSSINLAKRVVVKESSVYLDPPVRTFTNLNDAQVLELNQFYKEAQINQKMLKANQYFRLQQQAFLMPIVKQGRFELRLLLPHQFDAIPNDDFPTDADSFVMDTFDRSLVVTSDHNNQSIADKDDYLSTLPRYIYWSKELNFSFNMKGDITSDIMSNPINELPLIDISQCKDNEFFVRLGQSLADFAIQYCGYLSDLGHVVKMQGWSVAYMKGAKDLMPKSMRVGPSIVLHLPVDPNQPVDTEFGFASPNPDLAGSLEYGNNLVAAFLSSRGLEPDLVSGKAIGQKYSSGLERLLAELSQFEASKSDYDLFESVEAKLFDQIRMWSKVTVGTDEKFLSFVIPDNVEMTIQFGKPEMVQSEKDKADLLITKIDGGLMSRAEAIAEDRGIDIVEAEKVSASIDKAHTDLYNPPVAGNFNAGKATT